MKQKLSMPYVVVRDLLFEYTKQYHSSILKVMSGWCNSYISQTF